MYAMHWTGVATKYSINSVPTLLNEFQFPIVEFLSTLDWSIIHCSTPVLF